MKFFLEAELLVVLKIFGCVLLLWFAPVVLAHTGDGPHHGFLHGFLHPLSGIDHILAMIAVGLWSTQLSRQKYAQAVWLLPVVFVITMGFGGLLGMIVLLDLFAEHGIALSLLITGFLIARVMHLPFVVSALLIALFAVCHGYAHGSEMPDGVMIADYIFGFMLATALLHVSGIVLALMTYRFQRDQWLRYAGVAVALSGGLILIGGMG